MQQSAALLHDVTLTQILNLREKLLRNDGVESSRPLCIILGTRTNFSKRIEKLTVGIAEGKGLSQFVTWDEHSESIDDLEDANENEIGVEPTSNSQELQNISCGQDADAHQPARGVENGAAEEPAQGDGYEPEAADDAKPASTDSVSGDGSVQQTTATDANLSSLQNASENANASNEYFDEDDLIDYSEEEGDRVAEVQRHAKSHSNHEDRTNQGIFNLFPPCLKPNTCFCSKCSVLLLAEYEAINEDLRRRSLSRTNEDKVPEQSNEQASPATEGDNEGAYIEESGIEYEEKNEHQEGFQNAHLNTWHEDFTTGEFDTPDSLGQLMNLAEKESSPMTALLATLLMCSVQKRKSIIMVTKEPLKMVAIATRCSKTKPTFQGQRLRGISPNKSTQQNRALLWTQMKSNMKMRRKQRTMSPIIPLLLPNPTKRNIRLESSTRSITKTKMRSTRGRDQEPQHLWRLPR